MKYVKSTVISPFLMQALLQLWNKEYPTVISHFYNTLEDYLSKLNDLQNTFIFDDFGNLAGWYFDFERNKERQFAILISSDYQNNGIGKHLLEQAKARHKELFGWVVDSDEYLKSNGETYHSPLSFYAKSGFQLTGKRWDSENIKTAKIKWSQNFKKS